MPLYQNGGSKPFLGKELVPEATSPTTMLEALDFLLVSAHGATDLHRFMIVPDNTFLVFLAHSGFVRYVDRDLGKMKQLLKAEADTLYRNFITGQSKSLHFYPNAAIYCPGDLLPDSAISFRSGTQDVWLKGAYTLPVPADRIGDFALDRNLVYEIADWVNDGTLSHDYILNIAKLKPYKTSDFFEMVTLTDEQRIAKFGKSPQLKDWFNDVDAIVRGFDNSLFYLAEGNLAKAAPIEGLHLSEVIENIKSSKPYRFFFFTGCRGPLSPGHTAVEPDPNVFKVARPINIPFELPGGSLRRVARRFSLSAKCDMSEKRALSFLGARLAFAKMLGDEPTLREIAGAPESVKLMIRFFKENFLGDEFRFNSAPSAQQIAILLNLTYEEIQEGVAAALPLYVEFIEELRETFAEFTLQLRRESRANVRGLVIGDMFKVQLGLPIGRTGPNSAKLAASLRGEAASHAKVMEREYEAFKREMDARLKTYSYSYKSFCERVRKEMKELEERLHDVGANAEQRLLLQKDIETAYAETLMIGKQLKGAFLDSDMALFQNHLYLGERMLEYKPRDYGDLAYQIHTFERQLKPFQDMIARLVEKAEEQMREKTNRGGGTRRYQTRRLRLRR